jgi:hypothetical protein
MTTAGSLSQDRPSRDGPGIVMDDLRTDLRSLRPYFIPTTRENEVDLVDGMDADVHVSAPYEIHWTVRQQLHDLRGHLRDPASRDRSRHIWPAHSLICLTSSGSPSWSIPANPYARPRGVT